MLNNLYIARWALHVVEGKILMFLNRILGSQAETRRWALEIKPKGYRCGVSMPKQEIEAAPQQEDNNKA